LASLGKELSMSTAPKIESTKPTSGHIAATYCDNNRLYLFFRENLDVDLPPLSADLSIVSQNKTIKVSSINLQIDDDQSLIVLLLESPIFPSDVMTLRYRPAQWLMCTRGTADSIASFDEQIFPEPVEVLDPCLRLKTKFETNITADDIAVNESSVGVRFASEFRVQLFFADRLNTAIPIDTNDFRAETDDRWLKVTSARYVKAKVTATPEIQLEFSEPLDPGTKLTVGYRSPSKRLRTLESAALAPFHVDAIVEDRISGLQRFPAGDESSNDGISNAPGQDAHEQPTVDVAQHVPTDDVIDPDESLDASQDEKSAEPGCAKDLHREIDEPTVSHDVEVISGITGQREKLDTPATASEIIASNVAEHNEVNGTSSGKNTVETKIQGPKVILATDSPRKANISEKAERLKKTLSSQIAQRQKKPLPSYVRLIYFVPIVIFVWLLFVVSIYLATIVFDINLNVTKWGSGKPLPSTAPQKLQRESCSMKSEDGSAYKGECLKGERDGFGTYIWSSGNRYEGYWLNGKRHGNGRLIYASGAIYEGGYRAGRESGRGKMLWPNGASYEGGYLSGKFHGEGAYVSAAGHRFEGVFDRGSMTQDGICIKKGGEQYKGPC